MTTQNKDGDTVTFVQLHLGAENLCMRGNRLQEPPDARIATPGMTARGVKTWSSGRADDPSNARTDIVL